MQLQVLLVRCWAAALAILPGAAALSAADASAPCAALSTLPQADGPGGSIDGDQLWLVSSRRLGCSSAGEKPDAGLQIFRRDGDGCWQPSTGDAFAAAASAAACTCVYVHGNRIETSEAYGRGMAVYRALTRGNAGAPPLCFVIWSWPSSEICGPCRDARVKASRTHAESYHLARFLARHPQPRLSLLGYSFGGRIVCGALHLAGGGSLGGWSLAASHPVPPADARVVLLAAASDRHWLLPGGYHGRCLDQVDRLLNVYNPQDPVLRRYPRLERGSRDAALGYAGLPFCRSLDAAGQVDQINAACAIGRSHDEDRYYASGLVHEIRACLLQ